MTELRNLMVRYCHGDTGAFDELYEHVAPRLLGFLIKLSTQRSLAEDLLQETFIKIHRARASYIRSADPLPWMFAIAHRTFIDEMRRQGRSKERVAATDDLPEISTNHRGTREEHDDTLEDELVREALEALGSLPIAQREAVVLTKLEGKSVAEAAAIAGTTLGAMRVRMHRGYEILRRALNRTTKVEDAS
ncbi:MAG: RNA polymerase sigma factor [Kofleriaceae bacterium]